MESTCRSTDACVGCWLVSAVLMWCQASVTDLRSQATWAVCPKRNHSFHWIRNMLFTRVVELERASRLAWESRAGRRRPSPDSDIEQLFPERSQDSTAISQGHRSIILFAWRMMNWLRILGPLAPYLRSCSRCCCRWTSFRGDVWRRRRPNHDPMRGATYPGMPGLFTGSLCTTLVTFCCLMIEWLSKFISC